MRLLQESSGSTPLEYHTFLGKRPRVIMTKPQKAACKQNFSEQSARNNEDSKKGIKGGSVLFASLPVLLGAARLVRKDLGLRVLDES